MTNGDQSAPPPPPDPSPPAGGAGGADSLDPRVGSLLAYLLFGWIGGLIMYLTQKNPLVRFHGAQSVLVSIAALAVYIVLGIVTSVFSRSFAGWALIGLLNTVIGFAFLALWVLLCIKAYNLEKFKLPVIGDIAEKWASK